MRFKLEVEHDSDSGPLAPPDSEGTVTSENLKLIVMMQSHRQDRDMMATPSHPAYLLTLPLALTISLTYRELWVMMRAQSASPRLFKFPHATDASRADTRTRRCGNHLSLCFSG